MTQYTAPGAMCAKTPQTTNSTGDPPAPAVWLKRRGLTRRRKTKTFKLDADRPEIKSIMEGLKAAGFDDYTAKSVVARVNDGNPGTRIISLDLRMSYSFAIETHDVDYYPNIDIYKMRGVETGRYFQKNMIELMPKDHIAPLVGGKVILDAQEFHNLMERARANK
jgi:hypothetical protein